MHVVAQGVKLTGVETVNDKVDRRPGPRQTSHERVEEGGEIPWRDEERGGRMLDCLAAVLSTHAFELPLRFNF